MKKVPQTDCITCKHNEPFLNKKCVGCTNYINSNKESILKWEAKEPKTKDKKITMKVLHTRTANLISKELESIPEKYAKSNFASTHEAIAVIREEYMELEKEVFWGEKEAQKEIREDKVVIADDLTIEQLAVKFHNDRMKAEAVQLAAMCVRFIQECC